jgi:hypothetical protein
MRQWSQLQRGAFYSLSMLALWAVLLVLFRYLGPAHSWSRALLYSLFVVGGLAAMRRAVVGKWPGL